MAYAVCGQQRNLDIECPLASSFSPLARMMSAAFCHIVVSRWPHRNVRHRCSLGWMIRLWKTLSVLLLLHHLFRVSA